MTDEELDAIAARADAATAGPWFPDYDPRDDGADQVVTERLTIAFMATPKVRHERDAEFIAHAREDVPRLVAEVRRLRAEEARLRGIEAAYEPLHDEMFPGGEDTQ